jgi:hypothetical protein
MRCDISEIFMECAKLQKLDRDPNGVFMKFKYHFVWNVIHRKPVFRGSSKYFTVKQLRPVQLRNYLKSITKTRRYENTKQDIKKMNVQHSTSNEKRISNTKHSTAISVCFQPF